MRIAVDTNVLLRLVLGDDERQSLAALRFVEAASGVAISIHSLCELAWVLGVHNRMSRRDIADAIRTLLETDGIIVDRLAVDAGLLMLEAGGDFADGVIASDGRSHGGETFVSFDRQAVRLLENQGHQVLLLS